MEPALMTAAALAQLPSATFNALLLEAMGLREADKNNDYTTGTGFKRGVSARLWSFASGAGLASGAAPLQLDTTIDWRDRHVVALYINLTAATRAAGQTDDYQLSSFAPSVSFGYTGLGGLTAGGADPSAGNPPTLTTGKYLVTLATNVLLYASTVDHSLKVYNGSGSTIFPVIFLLGTGDTGKR
jgi:hypothetical protein